MERQDAEERHTLLGEVNASRFSRIWQLAALPFLLLSCVFLSVYFYSVHSPVSTGRSAAETDHPTQLEEVVDGVIATMHERTVVVNGATLSYAERSAEPGNSDTPLLMLHGYADSWKSFTNVLPNIPLGRRIVSLTHRGWGDSAKTGAYTIDAYASDVVSFVAELGVHRCVLVGHSMGTLISTAVAARHPSLVAGVALVSAAAKMRPERVLTNGTTFAALGDYVMEVFANDGAISDEGVAFLRAFQLDDLQPFLESGAVTQAFEYQVMNETLKATPRSYRDAFQSMLREDHTSELATIRQPVLVVWGTKDIVFDAEDQRKLQAALSQAVLTRRQVLDAPHAVLWTHGAVVAHQILDWLETSGL